MAMKSQWILLFATFILSCISIAFLITAFATTSWISGDLKPKAGVVTEPGTVNYGLFKGTATIGLATVQDLSIVCDYSENKCAYTCQTDPELQEEELKRLISGADLTGFLCSTAKSLAVGRLNYNTTGKIEATGKVALEDSFINASLYVNVLVFLSLSLFFAVVSAIFSLINVVFNPVEQIFGICGLYIWNGVAFILPSIVMTLYGILFGVNIYDNVAIRETLRVDSVLESKAETMLGFSYWFVIIPLFLHQINMILLWYRTRLINKEPPPPTIVVEKNDHTLMLY